MVGIGSGNLISLFLSLFRLRKFSLKCNSQNQINDASSFKFFLFKNLNYLVLVSLVFVTGTRYTALFSCPFLLDLQAKSEHLLTLTNEDHGNIQNNTNPWREPACTWVFMYSRYFIFFLYIFYIEINSRGNLMFSQRWWLECCIIDTSYSVILCIIWK